MAEQYKIIDRIFQPIYGLPCWNVKHGWGSFLTLEFGEPHLEIAEPRELDETASTLARGLFRRRRITLRGVWHLWIYCCDWYLYTTDQLIADSDPEGTTKERIAPAARELDGQKLLEVRLEPPAGTSLEPCPVRA